MMQSKRSSKKPVRFADEVFVSGANNKHTVGRKVDAGHDAAEEGDGAAASRWHGMASERWDVARVEADERQSDFIVDDVEPDQEWESESEGSESESESESDHPDWTEAEYDALCVELDDTESDDDEVGEECGAERLACEEALDKECGAEYAAQLAHLEVSDEHQREFGKVLADLRVVTWVGPASRVRAEWAAWAKVEWTKMSDEPAGEWSDEEWAVWGKAQVEAQVEAQIAGEGSDEEWAAWGKEEWGEWGDGPASEWTDDEWAKWSKSWYSTFEKS